MQYVSELELKAPQDVIRSELSEFPIPCLPIQNGLICVHGSCGYLCASLKRMKGHWTSIHGRTGTENVDWRHAPLQTFFRGNLLQYFTDPRIDRAIARPGRSNLQEEPLGLPDESNEYLLQHYIASTCLTRATNDDTKILWQVTVQQLARRSPFLMHGILACSALHLAHFGHPNRRGLMLKAISHHDSAMPLFRSAIEQFNESNYEAVFAFSHLLVIYSFALERDDEHLFLANSDARDVIPQWLHFVRDGCSMLCDFWDQLAVGPLSALVDAWEHEVPITGLSQATQTSWTNHLLSSIPSPASEDSWPEEVNQVYRAAAIQLGHAFSCADAIGQTFTTWDVLRIWPLEISKEFLDLLGTRHPAALILLAHYCVLLHKVEEHWYLEGRAVSLLADVLAHLEGKWHGYVQVPINEIPLPFSRPVPTLEAS